MSNKAFIDLSFLPPASAVMIELGNLEEQHPITYNWPSISRPDCASIPKDKKTDVWPAITGDQDASASK